ncbi:lasso peptide biosynthesis B2 protein [Rhodovulum sp. DZ06]|uniref:lasso peptide biosynthesis B2 protein n=1 Tax=Rhodovulum sp. DZ06 TaxID=3425126 RepID=UPI003D358DA3
MIGRLARLGPEKRRALAAAVWWLARARAWHARHSAAESFARLQAGGGAVRAAGSAPAPAVMRWALEAAGKRVPWRADCVVQALAAKFWLERAGVESAFRLGVQRVGGGLEAHAWLEVGGEAVSGGRPSGALARFAGAGPGGVPGAGSGGAVGAAAGGAEGAAAGAPSGPAAAGAADGPAGGAAED